MLSRVFLASCLGLLWGCDDGSGAAANDAGITDPGPLVDNAQWVPTEAGEAFFGAPPDLSECQLIPTDCDEYPWPEGDCVTFEAGSTCVASYVPECFDTYTVLAVYTRMPDNQIPLCNWLTLEQPSLRAIQAGDQVEIRAYHFTLTAPPGEEARLSFVVGDELAFDERIPIDPRLGAQFLSTIWTSPKDYPQGTPLLWHVDNHGTNEYLLIEVNVVLPNPDQ